MVEPWTMQLIHETICAQTFLDLKVRIPWEKRSDAPRYECWMMAAHLQSYTYGNPKYARTYEPRLMPEIVQKIGRSVKELLNVQREPEGCFSNMYRDGHDHLGWHADNSDMIDHEFPVVSVSFGDRRRIQFQSIQKDSPITELWMEPGSITVMPAGMQQTHKHRIPKEGFEVGERVSLTYRWLK